jgi:16S rRNA processing protein RimM
VAPTTDEPHLRFAAGATVILDEREVDVLDSRIAAKPMTVLLEGVTSREAAQALRGRWLFVQLADDESPETEDEYYDHQLVGLAVYQEGVLAGQVTEVLHLPAQDVLAVRTAAGAEVLVPFVQQVVPHVDVAAGRLEVAGVEGLFDGED